MGRIRTQFVKRLARKIIQQHGSQLSTDFQKNKVFVSQVADVKSKKLRNTIAGGITRMMHYREE